MLAQALSYAPNVNVAVLSAGRLLRLMDRVPQYKTPDKTEQREIQVQTFLYNQYKNINLNSLFRSIMAMFISQD